MVGDVLVILGSVDERDAAPDIDSKSRRLTRCVSARAREQTFSRTSSSQDRSHHVPEGKFVVQYGAAVCNRFDVITADVEGIILGRRWTAKTGSRFDADIQGIFWVEPTSSPRFLQIISAVNGFKEGARTVVVVIQKGRQYECSRKVRRLNKR